MLPKHIEALRSMTTSWEKTYRSEVAHDNFESLCPGLIPSGGASRSRATQRLLLRILEQQIVFVKYHVTCRVAANNSEESFARMRRFLSQQRLVHPGNGGTHIIFFDALCSARTFLWVEELSDIDFADLSAATMFEFVAIGHTRWATVTQRRIDTFRRMLKKDLEYDGYKVRLHVSLGFAKGTDGPMVGYECAITGEMSMDKIAKIRMCKEFTSGDVFKWFMP
jgi:hypothetical protein